ncbi:MAG: acylphosphatase [Patescibacteria group bacterium]
MTKHIKLKITGQVQGVGFRWSSYEKFVELGLTGKAENGKDGSVEVDVSGEDFNLEKFVEWARVGSQGARVGGIEVNEIEEKPSVGENSDNDKNEQN